MLQQDQVAFAVETWQATRKDVHMYCSINNQYLGNCPGPPPSFSIDAIDAIDAM